MAVTTRNKVRRSERVKASFVLTPELLDAMRKQTRDGFARSVNAFVVEALREKLDRLEAARMRELLVEASKDPLFLADIEAVQRDFEGSERPPRRGTRGR
jgi:hypothetical protein